ncbi:unnamed protein product [Closterium sp. Yama58-4]|nr:unnamed protein product [Closterium sp. Yama58-4]
MLPSYYLPARPRQSSNSDSTAAVGGTGNVAAVVGALAVNSENGTTLGFPKPATPAAARFSAQLAAHLQRASHENGSSDDEEEEGEGEDDEEAAEAEEAAGEARDAPPINYSACHEKVAEGDDAAELAFARARNLHVSPSRRRQVDESACVNPRCVNEAAGSPFSSPSTSPSAASVQRSPTSSKSPKTKRKSKLRLSAAQIQVLESHFTEIEREIKLETRLKLASQLRLKPRQVAVWFQNRRVKHATLAREGELARLRAELAQAHAELAELRKENERAKREMGELAEEHKELKSKYDALLPRSSKRKSPENESMRAPSQKRVKQENYEDTGASAGCAEQTDARQCGEQISVAAEGVSDINCSDKTKMEACNTDEDVLMTTFLYVRSL